jgi:hypothetical protein
MKMVSVEDRLRTILEKDWKQAATELLAERKRTGVGEVWSLYPPFRAVLTGVLLASFL